MTPSLDALRQEWRAMDTAYESDNDWIAAVGPFVERLLAEAERLEAENARLTADLKIAQAATMQSGIAETMVAQQVERLEAQVAALRDVLIQEPFGDGLTDLLTHAAKCLWGQRPNDDPIQLGRILSGRASRIEDAVGTVLHATEPSV